MAWFLIVVMAVVAILAVAAVVAVVSLLNDENPAALEAMRIEMEVRRAERRLHTLARDGFQAMLDEARRHGGPS